MFHDMSKLKILTFKNNRKAYATEGIMVSLNKEKPISVQEISIDENQIKELFREGVEADIRKGKLRIKRIKKKSQGGII